MPMNYSIKLEFDNKDNLRHAYLFITPLLKERNVIPRCDEGDLTISYGLTSHSWEVWHKEVIVELAKEFPGMSFRITAWDDQANFWWGYNKHGIIEPVDHYEDILEMIFRWYIDVDDPFAGPTEENWAELRRCREQHVQEMIDLGVDITPGTWPPTNEQEEQEYRFRYKLEHGHCPTESSDDNELPF